MATRPRRASVAHWITRQAIVTDWYDGPREGVCALESPKREFWFDLLAERQREDGVDDRLFLLSEVPDGTVDYLIQRLSMLGTPSGRVWAPKWLHPDREALGRLEVELQPPRTEAADPSEVVLTIDMLSFAGLWRVQDAGSVNNWFAFLKL
jgi:hypothetical protein